MSSAVIATNFEPLLQGEHVDAAELRDDMIRDARLTVAGYAYNSGDCRYLLDVLGLLPGEEDVSDAGEATAETSGTDSAR